MNGTQIFGGMGIVSGNILKYYLYKSTKAVEFYCPIMYLFFLTQGSTSRVNSGVQVNYASGYERRQRTGVTSKNCCTPTARFQLRRAISQTDFRKARVV